MRPPSYLCGVTLVIFQEPAEPFTTLHRTLTLRGVTDDRKEQDIVLTLMIPLMMIMLDVLVERMLEGSFPKQDQSRETLLLDRAHPPLRIRIEIRRPWRQWDSRHPSCINEMLKGRAVFSVPVMEEVLPR